jgi:hypothetical protein
MRRGFTILEVVLFLAVTMALIAGMFVGTTTNIDRERYNDSVESFKSFLQEQYEIVANPQGLRDGGQRGVCSPRNAGHGQVNFNATGGINLSQVAYVTTDRTVTDPSLGAVYRGRSNCLIYGRLIEFTGTAAEPRIAVSSVVGLDIEAVALSNHDFSFLNNLVGETDTGLLTRARPGRADDTQIFTPAWNATVRGLNVNLGAADGRVTGVNGMDNPLRGAILIARMPMSGSVRTFITTAGDTCDWNAGANRCNNAAVLATNGMLNSTVPRRYFCVIEAAGSNRFAQQRRVVRLRGNIGNSTAPDILSLDETAIDENMVVRCPAT